MQGADGATFLITLSRAAGAAGAAEVLRKTVCVAAFPVLIDVTMWWPVSAKAREGEVAVTAVAQLGRDPARANRKLEANHAKPDFLLCHAPGP